MIPYEFLMDYLYPLKICIKPMFGSYGIFRNESLLLFLRKEAKHSELNGIYIATTAEHHAGLLRDIPSTYHKKIIPDDKKTWIFLPEYGEHFEEWARKTCEMIRIGDERIGRVQLKVI